MNADCLQVKLVDGQITVTRPSTNDTITYRKSEEAPHLELAHSWIGAFDRKAECMRALYGATLAARHLRGAAQLDLTQSILVPAWHPVADLEMRLWGAARDSDRTVSEAR